MTDPPPDPGDPRSAGWQDEVDELHRREALAQAMGGPEKIERQHAGGKLTVRERLDALLDPDSFHEIGALAGKSRYDPDGALVEFTPSNFVMGRGRIDGRPVVVGGDDFTVRGGAADAAIWQKQVYAEQMAHELRLPLVRLVDGTGGGGSVKSLDTDRRTYVPPLPGWHHTVENLASVPVVALALGSVAGLGAARVVNSHYSLMVRDTSQVFVAGPPVVARVEAAITKEELGGDHIHGRNGVVDDVVDSEAEAFERTRRFLSYLPSSVHDVAPRTAPYRRPRARATSGCCRPCRAPRGRSTRSDPSSRRWWTPAPGWRSAEGGGGPRCAAWPASTAGRWRSCRRTPTRRAAAGRPTPATRSLASWTWPTPSTCPWCTWWTSPASWSGWTASGPAPSATASGPSPPSTRPRSPGARCSSARCTASAAPVTRARPACRIATPGHRARGGRSPSRAASKRPSGPSSTRWTTRPGPARIAEITARMESVRSPFRTAEAFLVEELIDPRRTRPLLCEFANLAAPLRQPGRTSRTYRP